MVMKRILIILLACVMLTAAFGCAGSKPEARPEGEPKGEYGSVSFSATDIDGAPVSLEGLSDKRVIMINFFESWCSPCMRELPDIASLYEKYKGEGFAVLGVYSSSDEAALRSAMEDAGVTYPVFEVTEELRALQTQYVPTTVFIDGDGNILTSQPYVGSRSYSGWESVITSLLYPEK